MKLQVPITFRKLYALFGYKEKLKLLVLFCMMLVAALLEIAGIGMIPGFVAIVADPVRVMEYEPVRAVLNNLGITGPEELLLWGGLALIGIYMIKNVYLIGYSYLENRFINNQMYHLSDRLMSSYIRAPYVFHLQRNSAELLRNINYESNLVMNGVVLPLMKILKEGVIGTSIFLFILFIEPLITLMVFLLLGSGISIFLFMTQKRIKRYGKEEQDYRHDMIKAINQGLGAIKDARVLNRERHFISQFRNAARHRARLLAFRNFISQIPKPVVECITVGGMILIAILMIEQDRPMSAIIPILSLFAMATVRLMPAIQQIAQNYTKLRYNIVSVNPVYDDLHKLSERESMTLTHYDEVGRLGLDRELVVRNVCFNYPNSTELALDGVSFTVTKGKAVAFVGASGAGKTTIIDLLLGLLEPTRGTISVDGINIQNNLSAWQRNIGYVPQSIYLSDESLRNNIAFGIPEDQIDEQKLWEAVKLAQLKELIIRMPDGLDTVIGELGTRLSGGQQQRVGIARALYHNPQVLVMDEATSALDNITEKYIMKAIEQLKHDRTIIMIAHRLTTVMNCDQLYLMEEGRIIKNGTYSELITMSKQFREMAIDHEDE